MVGPGVDCVCRRGLGVRFNAWVGEPPDNLGIGPSAGTTNFQSASKPLAMLKKYVAKLMGLEGRVRQHQLGRCPKL